ncbi:arsenic transporter [Patulibacter minatonensis]|uniref:arsenic transporter n=1 Tax=Patulibacter minatonensis TaxID=298163 RepID=UPI00047DCA06|nr:arsenic transporter [Patulibacter minatonensis]
MLVLAIAIFLATLAFVIWQPRGLPIGFSALAGAAVAIAVGVVSFSDVPTVWDIVWNATITFVAVILISLILDEAGFFEWAALHVARWGRGDGKLLFTLIIVLGAAIASVFANDGAALILTPIVINMLVALRFSPAASLAYVMACGFIADAGSLPLVVSNLVNIVVADFFDITFGRYALVMVPVAIASLLASLTVLRLCFRKAIPRTYDMGLLGDPTAAIEDPLVFRAGWGVLGVLLVGYFVADPIGVPIAAVAGTCAVVLVLVAARRPTTLFARPRSPADADADADAVADVAAAPAVLTAGGSRPTPTIDVVSIVRGAPWQVVLFSLGMYLVVYGMRNEGLTDDLGDLFRTFSDSGSFGAAYGTGFVVTGMSSVANNMPTVLIASLGVDAAGASGLPHQLMVYATVIGADLGPKITPIGSLATLLWLHVLDRKGIRIGWGTYFRVGIVLTVPVVAITLLTLVGWLTLIGA